MSEKTEIIKRIKDTLAVLEKEGHDEFDLITGAFSVWHEITDLISKLWDNKKIEDWRQRDDPSFYRFASKLKLVLELQRDYLSTISEPLILDGDTVSKKIKDYQQQINSKLKQEKTILKEVDALIRKEDELREAKKRLNIVLSKKNELEKIKKKLSSIDIKSLEKEVADKEKKKDELIKKYKPLLDKKETLQGSLTELNEAINNMSAELTRLETAYAEEAHRLMESIPQWIEKIKNRRIQREDKDNELMERMEKEAEELKETERKLQEHINQMNEFISLAMTNREILRTHFEANKTIGSRFSMSLHDIQDNLSSMTDTVEKQLTRFDELLKVAQKKIQEVASQFKPIRIGE